MAMVSLFCDCWIINTIRKVTMVVPVLMTSCHVSENLNMGPVIPHTTITNIAEINAIGLPVALVTLLEKASKALNNFFFICGSFCCKDSGCWILDDGCWMFNREDARAPGMTQHPLLIVPVQPFILSPD